ncbi:carbamoyltransferase HypF [Elusimicrobiota bacterium]
MLKTLKENNKKLSAFRIKIKGHVQGVGFRPTVYRLAVKKHLKGAIANTASGVAIELLANKSDVKSFLIELKKQISYPAKIKNISVSETPIKNFKAFTIEKSTSGQKTSVDIPADLSICADCGKELLSYDDRRYLYPFINCTNCGPRFTITSQTPYDRKNTTMNGFKMCESCSKEYDDPADRRFHAQPNACPDCGPKVMLLSNKTEKVSEREKALKDTVHYLKKGKIIAIKSLGGYHLVCDAENPNAIKTLRKRKNRQYKPFAIMTKDIQSVQQISYVNHTEHSLLTSPKKPIVLLQKRAGNHLDSMDEISPNNLNIGVMLPYTPLHKLLFSDEKYPFRYFIMTSGNKSDEPICCTESSVGKKLSEIADYFLVNNRPIHNRCDDSILKDINDKPDKSIFIRRSRGYVPDPLDILKSKNIMPILATGAELKNTFCITRGSNAYVSQYIGDMDNKESLDFYEEAIERFKKYLDVEPSLIVHDFHPNYLSTIYAKRKKKDYPKIKLTAVQHHHAHAASVIAEHKIKKQAIAFIFDGNGYGLDGKVWGGECFLCNGTEFTRYAHFDYFLLPGGDIAVKEIWRLAASVLEKAQIREIPRHISNNIHYSQIKNIIENRINSLECCSVGRIFDAVAAILGLRNEVSYEAQAAMELEVLAVDKKVKKGYNFSLFNQNDDASNIVSIDEMFGEICSDKNNGLPLPLISAKFHLTMAKIVEKLAKKAKKEFKVESVILSGGVFQNRVLLTLVDNMLKKAGFKVYWNNLVPPNDGGISLGQAWIASNQR